MFINLLIISIILIGIAMLLLGIRLLIDKGSRFPDTHVGSNPGMKKLGISCAQSINVGCKPAGGITGCPACSGEE
jgi:hypothetical protein